MDTGQVADIVGMVRRGLPHQRMDAGAIVVWEPVLARLPYADAEAVVFRLLGEQSFIAPADIVAGVHRLQRDRLNAIDPDSWPEPNVDPDDAGGYLAEQRALQQAVACGAWAARELEAYAAAGRPLTAGARPRVAGVRRPRPVAELVAAVADTRRIKS